MKIDKRITPPAASKVSSVKGKGGGKSTSQAAGGDSVSVSESS